MWQKKKTCFMVIAILMLTSLVFCLEIVPKGKSVHFGRLITGSSRITNETKDGILKKLRDEYAGDTKDYQSDQLQWTEGSQLAKSKLQHLSPSVQCDDDSMSLYIQGNQIPNFLVETSEEGLVPLSRMPSHCGFSMKRARRAVALVANYDSCNVAQQGNTYILPLRILGAAVTMACPVARPLTRVSCSPTAMIVNLGMSIDAVRLKVNGVWQPVYQASTTCGFTLQVMEGGLALIAPYSSNCWQFEGAEMLLSVQYMNGELTVSCPAVQLPDTTPLPATMYVPLVSPVAHVLMGYLFPYGYGRTWHFHYRQPGNTTVAPAGPDQQVLYPWLPGVHYPYGIPWHFHYGRPRHPPVTRTTAALTTTTTAAPASAGQKHPWLPGVYYPYGIPWHFHKSGPRNPPATRTTAAPTTTVAPASAGQKHYPWFPGMYYPYGIPWHFHYGRPRHPPVTHTTAALTTTTTAAPPSAGQKHHPWLPGMYYPYGIPWHFHKSGPRNPPVTRTTATPTTTVAPASAGQKHYPWFPGMYYPYGMLW